MIVNKLLGEHLNISGNAERHRKVADDLQSAADLRKDQIIAEVHREFGEFLDEIFADMPTERRITEWFVNYITDTPLLYVGVTEIGGQQKQAGSLGPHGGRLPEHLREAESFGKDYSVDVKVEHVYEVDDIK